MTQELKENSTRLKLLCEIYLSNITETTKTEWIKVFKGNGGGGSRRTIYNIINELIQNNILRPESPTQQETVYVLNPDELMNYLLQNKELYLFTEIIRRQVEERHLTGYITHYPLTREQIRQIKIVYNKK